MNRETLIRTFLGSTGWRDATRTPIAADASARQYFRLKRDICDTAILMDANPTTGEDIFPFIKIGIYLNDAGLAAPHILEKDTKQGFILLEDLGPSDFSNWLTQNPLDERKLYTAATDVLIALHKTPAPQDLLRMTPATGSDMVAITAEWYAENTDPKPLVTAMNDALSNLTPLADTIALRDFHAENLIWRPDRRSLDRIGLLDFQDAFIAPSGYDLVSLLKDARRDVDPNIAHDLIVKFASATDQNPTAFTGQCACISVQRNLRILGVFARLIRRDGKLKYAQFVPRVWSHIQADLRHPALIELQRTVNVHLPSPSTSMIADYL